MNLATNEQVRHRAHEIFRQNGSQPGHAVDDWLQAEYELMQLPIRTIAAFEQPRSKRGGKLSLVALVQAAVIVGAKALPHLKG